MSDQMYLCGSGLFSSCLADTMSAFVEYKVNVGGCVPESFLPVLKRFDRYLAGCLGKNICFDADTVLGFMESQDVKNSTAARQESVLRSLGQYMSSVLGMPGIYMVPRLIKRKGRTFIPYVFSRDEIHALLEAAERYQPKCHNKPTVNILNCMRCIMALLYCTGMRVSEVSSLAAGDVDMEQGLIHINRAKNDNRRIVTMSRSLKDICGRYLDESKRHKLSGVYFFDSGSPANSGRVTRSCIYSYYRRFLSLAGISHNGAGFGPRLHDLRVTFAIHSLKRLTEENGDVNACLYYLSTYMGHMVLCQEKVQVKRGLFVESMESYSTVFCDHVFQIIQFGYHLFTEFLNPIHDVFQQITQFCSLPNQCLHVFRLHPALPPFILSIPPLSPASHSNS